MAERSLARRCGDLRRRAPPQSAAPTGASSPASWSRPRRSARGRVAVIGIGINIRAQAVADAASGVASLAEIDAAATPATTLARVAPAAVRGAAPFDAGGFAAFADRFAARDLLRGRRVAGAGAHGDVEGIAAGIAGDGSAAHRHRRRARSRSPAANGASRASQRGGFAMLRALLALLIVANLLFFAFTPRLARRRRSACARSAIASPSASPARCGRRRFACCRPAPPRARRPIDAGVPCYETPTFTAGDAAAVEAALAANLPAGSWIDNRGERNRRRAHRGDAHLPRRSAPMPTLTARLATLRLDAAGRGFSFSPCARAERPPR